MRSEVEEGAGRQSGGDGMVDTVPYHLVTGGWLDRSFEMLQLDADAESCMTILADA